ncbi:hypothetical protein CRE_04967 [Caenorhabditis remanei]|uniref:Uncharacterized protein n=1 Tax=Caenorhabditis remanei TaxID=31234 RepID=E3MN81_CAERE|nr:hypothetical protein CRE_04967 [Caenorhabditis remanei]
MLIILFLLCLFPLTSTKPINEKNITPGSNVKEDVKCYFSRIRKTTHETVERSEKSIVSTICSGKLEKLEKYSTLSAGPEVKDEHPLSVIMCRGAGMCDLNFLDPLVMDKWKTIDICEHHVAELLTEWNLLPTFRETHIYRVKTQSFGTVEACSMPDSIGTKHEKGRPIGRSHLSVKAADALIKQDHTLVHPGIPLCRSHENYIRDLMSKPRPPPTKKSRTSSESDSCSSEDPPYASSEESITQKKEITLAESFSQFAMLAGETKVCTVKPWNQLKHLTQEKKARTARNLFLTMLGIMVPDDTEEFKKLVERKTFVGKQWSTGSSASFEAVMEQLAVQFFAAECRRSRLLVLSFVTNSVSYLEMVKYIPHLSRYMYESSKIFGRRKRSENAVKERQLVRYDHKKVQAFIDFITSPTVMIGLPYGVRNVKLSDGTKMEIPNSIRQQSATEVIEMWKNVCMDNDQPDLLLSVSTMYKILEACVATKRESTTCVDYFIAYGMQGFEDMHRVVDGWLAEELFSQSLTQLKTALFEVAQYYRTDYRLHIKSQSRVADHCASFALSDPSDKRLSSPCSSDPHKHSHDLKCDRCQHVNSTLEKLRDYAEEFLLDSREALKTADESTKQNIQAILERREDDKKVIERSIAYVHEMKKHLLRAAFTSQEREKIISGLKDNEALVTLDFAQKFLPKFHRELQSQYYGKKGVSYHISHVVAKIGDRLVQHSFVHVYSGPVTQVLTLY